MEQAYEADKKYWLTTNKFSERTSGLFNPELVGTRGEQLTAKCYLIKNDALNKKKCCCKGVSQKHNSLYFQRYKNVSVVFPNLRRDSELEEKDIGKAKKWALMSMIKAL